MTRKKSQTERKFSEQEKAFLAKLDSPFKIQGFLDTITYSSDPFYRCPLRVLRERIGHCFDGAVFAAFALQRIGHPQLIIELLPNDRDDDHLLALFRMNGRWGSIGKSNFTGLRFREPIFKNLRELVLSYFESYYNVAYEKTLRGFTLPLDLTEMPSNKWITNDEPLEEIAAKLDKLKRFSILTKKMEKSLSPVDEKTYQSGLQGSVPEGLFRPT
jgi:hypothetical protein